MIWLVNCYLCFYPISSQREFSNRKIHLRQGRTKWCCVFFQWNFNKSLCKTIFLVRSHLRTSSLVCAPPQLTLLPSPDTCVVDNFQSLRFGNSQSTYKLTVKYKRQISVYIYISYHLPVYKFNGSLHCWRRRRTNFRNWRSKIYRKKIVLNKW